MEKQKKRRIIYSAGFVVLLIVEVLIALYIHDNFIRPYIGDVLVVVVLYCLIRIFVPVKCRLLPLWIFIFAAGVEILQLFHIVDRLGLGDIMFFRILIGSVFDMKDVVCYAIGCVMLGIHELVLYGKAHNGRDTKDNHDESVI